VVNKTWLKYLPSKAAVVKMTSLSKDSCFSTVNRPNKGLTIDILNTELGPRFIKNKTLNFANHNTKLCEICTFQLYEFFTLDNCLSTGRLVMTENLRFVSSFVCFDNFDRSLYSRRNVKREQSFMNKRIILFQNVFYLLKRAPKINKLILNKQY